MKRQELIDIASKEIGVTEDPAGSNNVKYNDWFYGAEYAQKLSPNQKEWCGVFMSWVYAMAIIPLDSIGWSKGFASVPMAFMHWKDRITQNPLPGDLVIFDWDRGHKPEGDWSADHVEMFKEWIDEKAQTFYTIGGNTSSGPASKGGQVRLCQRNMAYVQVFINPKLLPPDSIQTTTL